MKQSKLSILFLVVALTGAINATEPTLKQPPKLKSIDANLGYYVKAIQGFDGLEVADQGNPVKMVQVCENGVCKMVPKLAAATGPTVTAASGLMGEICQDCGKVHTRANTGSNGLLYKANGRQRLFQPFRRWRLRFSAMRLFPNAWWNK